VEQDKEAEGVGVEGSVLRSLMPAAWAQHLTCPPQSTAAAGIPISYWYKLPLSMRVVGSDAHCCLPPPKRSEDGPLKPVPLL